MTTYLIDPANHTGYAQVLEETTYDDDGSDGWAPATRIYYTIGDDVLSQTTSTYSGGWPTGITKYLLYDGHGSTRQLIDSGQNIGANYNYDAYGTLLQGGAAESSPGMTPQQNTSLLYAGEMFDTNSQQYYNRARWYNTLNGTFNRVDPYAGNLQDPQSLHKYAYVHNNPVNWIDPSGESYTYVETMSVSKMMGMMIMKMAPYVVSAIEIGATVGLGALVGGLLQKTLSVIYDMIADDVVGAWKLLTAAVTAGVITLAMHYESALLEAADALGKTIEELKRLPVFFIFEAAMPTIFWYNAMYLELCPAWYVLNYSADPIQYAVNRLIVMGMYGHLRREGESIDEFPFASTVEGGFGAVGYSVPWIENCIQGGYLGAFYRWQLLGMSRDFLLVPIPVD